MSQVNLDDEEKKLESEASEQLAEKSDKPEHLRNIAGRQALAEN